MDDYVLNTYKMIRRLHGDNIACCVSIEFHIVYNTSSLIFHIVPCLFPL